MKNFKYKCVNSTNNVAIKLIKQKNIKSGIVISQTQKKGRGQRGKKWISYKGNLFVSIFFSIEKINMTIKQLAIINAKLIIKVLSKYYKKNINIKLPNDILIKNKKICGILQETVQKNNIKYLIVGIGINLVKSPKINNYPTTNLYDLTKNKINFSQFLRELKNNYKVFLKSQKVI